MGLTTPPDKQPLSALDALAREKPAQLMAQLRTFWPQVQRALEAGHTLRLIHQRLNLAGVPISYKVLVVYRGRIERGEKRRIVPASLNKPLLSRSPDSKPPAFDLLANFHAQEEKKRMGWRYPSSPPDESKLL
jgi:hypothetical protein